MPKPFERRSVLVAALALGFACQAGADPADQWRLETELGYAHAGGALADAFGGGLALGWTIGHRVGKPVLEAGAHLAWVGYADARTVSSQVCVPRGIQSLVCSDAPTAQEGRRTTFLLGLSLPFSLSHDKRTLQVGAGGFLESVAVEPDGASLGTRTGSGVYLKLAADVVTLGSAGIGLIVRAARGTSHGATFGALSASSASDGWIEASLLLRVGAGAGHGSRPAHP